MRVDIVADRKNGSGIFDYNEDNIDEKIGRPVGTVKIQAFLLPS